MLCIAAGDGLGLLLCETVLQFGEGGTGGEEGSVAAEEDVSRRGLAKGGGDVEQLIEGDVEIDIRRAPPLVLAAIAVKDDDGGVRDSLCEALNVRRRALTWQRGCCARSSSSRREMTKQWPFAAKARAMSSVRPSSSE